MTIIKGMKTIALRHSREHRERLRQAMIERNKSDPPKARPCKTPLGEFDSLTLAAKAHDVSRQAVHQRINAGSEGWRYSDH